MKDLRDPIPNQARLRWRAEELAKGSGTPSPTDALPLIHELRVSQIELQLQNEELLRTQDQLESARSRYFDLYELAPVGYCVVSMEGLILEANLSAVNLLGISRASLIKQRITHFILKEDQDIYYLHRRQLLGEEEPRACELRMVKKDGTSVWVRLTATTAHDAAGAPVIRVVLSDISDRKGIEDEKAALEVQLLQTRHHQRPVLPIPRSGGASNPTKK